MSNERVPAMTCATFSPRFLATMAQDNTTLDASLFSDLAMRKPDAYLGISGRDHYEHHLGGVFVELPLEGQHDGGCHLGVVASADAQIGVGLAHGKVGEERGVQGGVVLRSGVDYAIGYIFVPPIYISNENNHRIGRTPQFYENRSPLPRHRRSQRGR